MGNDEREYQSHHVIIEEQEDDTDSPTNAAFISSRNRCCFTFPCFGSPPPPPGLARLTGPSSSSSSSKNFWDRFRAGEPSDDSRWWARPVLAFKKIREWSEIVAGPKWKTFIRRFNRNRNRHHVGAGKFQYDPLSYALNFDEGPAGQNGQFEEDYDQFPDFSSRFAAIPISARSSMDLGKGAPAG